VDIYLFITFLFLPFNNIFHFRITKITGHKKSFNKKIFLQD
jgi:hypothetical protein